MKEDLIGRKFNKLLVIDEAKSKIYPCGTKVKTWLCKCDCGNIKIVIGRNLKNGTTKSCGCLKKEKSTYNIQNYNDNRVYNTYDLSGEYGIGYTSKGEEFYFDLEDYNLIKNYSWSMKSSGYLQAKINNKIILFHRLLFGNISNEIYIDHINHNIKDNRKQNLRFVTKSQNSMNHINPSNSKTGVSGVIYNKRNNNWRARITVNGNRIEIGSFTNFDDAVKARKEAEEKYFGEYSYDNSMILSNK